MSEAFGEARSGKKESSQLDLDIDTDEPASKIKGKKIDKSRERGRIM